MTLPVKASDETLLVWSPNEGSFLGSTFGLFVGAQQVKAEAADL